MVERLRLGEDLDFLGVTRITEPEKRRRRLENADLYRFWSVLFVSIR